MSLMPFFFFSYSRTDRRTFVARASYAKLLAMPAYMSVKPFEAFPKELHVCRKTHVAFITRSICYAHVKVLKIWFPVCGQYLLKGFNVKTGCYLITDGAYYLVVGYRGRWIYHDSAEHLVMYVPVKMFHQLSI